jgi:hypothetical protein
MLPRLVLRCVCAISLSLMTIGCDVSGRPLPSGSHFRRGQHADLLSVRSKMLEYYTDVYAPQSRYAITTFGWSLRTVIARADEAAAITRHNVSGTIFPSKAMRARWVAANMPQLATSSRETEHIRVPAAVFSFLPVGTPLTYQQVLRLPDTPQGVAQTLIAHLPPDARDSVLVLKDYAFLLGAAPISETVRRALVKAIYALRGVQRCDGGRQSHAPSEGDSTAVCAISSGFGIRLTFNANGRGAVDIVMSLASASHYYPGMSAGAVVERCDFSPVVITSTH